MARNRHSARLSFENLEGRDVPAAGSLDPTFGFGGQVNITTPQPGIPSPIEFAYASTVQSDGKIIVVGTVGQNINGPNQYLSGSPSPDFAAVRLNPNGSVDTTFGTNGLARIPFDVGTGSLADVAYSVGLQSDGHIVISGYAGAGADTSPSQEYDWAITRLNTDGSLDTTFGANGLVTFAFGGTITGVFPTDMVIAPNDYIDLVGRNDVANQSSFEVVRLTPRGVMDPFFGSGGVLGGGQVTITNPTPISGGATAVTAGFFNKIAVLPNGAIILAGNLSNRAGDYVVAKLNSAGVLDTTFGVLNAAGTARTGFAFANLNPTDPITGQPGVFNGAVGNLAIDASGNILVTGRGNGDFLTVRFTPKGVKDTTFGTNGVSTVAFNLGGNNGDTPEGIAIQPDGKIVLGGEAQTGINTASVFAAARLTSAGALDTTFGIGGKQTYSVNNPSGIITGIAAHSLNFTSSGKILLVGQNGTEITAMQLLNNTTFNPLPPPPVPPSGVAPPLENPGTTISLLSAARNANQVFLYQQPNPSNFQYDPNTASNFALASTVDFLTTGFSGVIRTSIGDVNGDGTPDIAVITGPGTPTRFAVINGANSNQFIISPRAPFPGSEDFTGGGYVTTGDLNNDGRADVVISADVGGGPRITIYSYNPGVILPARTTIIADFLGIADPSFRGGARTAIGDINGDGIPDLAVAAGFGGGPRIALYNGATLFTTLGKLTNDFFAFSPNLTDGAYVAIGDVDGDGYKDLIFGAGDGGSPRILIVSGQKITTNPVTGLNSPISSFFMNGDTSSRGGVRVAVKNVDGDQYADIVAGSGENVFSQVRVYRGISVKKSGEPTLYQDLNPFNTIVPDGVYVG